MMRQGYDRVIVQTQGYMKNTWSRTCFMAGLMVSFMAGGLALSVGNAHAATVFLVCDGTFYLSIDGSEGIFSRIKLQPFERDVRLPSLDLQPEETMENGIMRSVNIVANDDELLLSARSESGGLVEALVDGRPMTPTREIVKDMSLSLNRFNGRLEIEWKDHEVRDYKPVGAIRSTKKRYSDIKRFDAMCKTMQERLF